MRLTAHAVQVIEYCTYHTDKVRGTEDERDAWDKRFAGVDVDRLFSLILAANYLGIKPLLDLACKAVAQHIKACRTPQEIQRNIGSGPAAEQAQPEDAWQEFIHRHIPDEDVKESLGGCRGTDLQLMLLAAASVLHGQSIHDDISTRILWVSASC